MGLTAREPYRAVRDLLLREIPRVGGQPLHRQEETPVEAAVRLCEHLTGGVLPIQRDHRGSGKTFSGARMICELVQRGKTVGRHSEQSQSYWQSARRGYRGGRSARCGPSLLPQSG